MNDATEHDAERFLTALQDKVQELLALSKVPSVDPDNLSFVDYTKFRSKTDECLSFLVIIEGRINEVEGERKELLSEQFDKLVTATWSVLMEGSISFLSVLSEREYLPVGTRHVFEQELKTLSEAEEVMKDNKNEKFLSSSMIEKRAKAREILNVVIDKAPELLNVQEDLDMDTVTKSHENEPPESHPETLNNDSIDLDSKEDGEVMTGTEGRSSVEVENPTETLEESSSDPFEEENKNVISSTERDQNIILESDTSLDIATKREEVSEVHSSESEVNASESSIPESNENSNRESTSGTEI